MKISTVIIYLALPIVIVGLVVWVKLKPSVDSSAAESVTENNVKDWEDNAPSDVTLDPATLDSEIMVHPDGIE